MNISQENIALLVKKCGYLFWWMSEEAKARLSPDSWVESILSYGTEEQITLLFDVVGLKNTAEIFRRQTAPDKMRINYKDRTKYFFNLYFDRHVPRNPQ
ncbi:MAG: hypothetical protein AAF849_01535 [Bacteroidota bacterium]